MSSCSWTRQPLGTGHRYVSGITYVPTFEQQLALAEWIMIPEGQDLQRMELALMTGHLTDTG